MPSPDEDNRAKKRRRILKTNTLDQWGGMTKGPQDAEARQALKLLHYGSYLSGSVYERPDKEPLPEFYELAVEVGSKTNINQPYEQTKKRRNLAGSLVKSILKTDRAQQLLKEHQSDKATVSHAKDKAKTRKNAVKRSAKKRKRAGAGL